MNGKWLAAVAVGVVGAGLVLGSGVANGAPRTGQPLSPGYAMMTELFGGRGTAGPTTVPNGSDGLVAALHQNMLAVHTAMLRYGKDGFGGTGGYAHPYMGGAYGEGSPSGVGYGYMMGGYAQPTSSSQRGTYLPMMGGY